MSAIISTAKRYSIVVAGMLCLLMIIAGCGGSKGTADDTPEAAYTNGARYFEEQRYPKAIRSLQRVFEFGRVHEWADDAQFLLGRAYYEDGQYLLSSNECERFVGLYPSDERVEDAAYYRAMSYYQLSPDYNLDATETKRAIEYLRLYIAAYPNTEHKQDVGLRIDELQEKLALKLIQSAHVYENGGQFEAAALTFERVLAEYPATSSVDEALFGAMHARVEYAQASIITRQAERLRAAVEVYNSLYQLFPESPYLKDAEALYAEVQQRLQAVGG